MPRECRSPGGVGIVGIDSPVSFVIPAYNCADTVGDALASILRGNFEPDDEIVVVDDASTDHTAAVLAQLQEHPEIKIVTNRVNKGCPASRNIGISHARHALLFNLDADDLLVPGTRRRLQDALVAESADAAVHAESHFFQSNPHVVTHKWICPSGFLTLADYLDSHIVPGVNYLYTRRSWEWVGGYPEYGGFMEFWGHGLNLVATGARVFVVENSHYYHRVGHQSLWVRESQDPEASSRMASRMIAPYLHLLHPEDVAYLRSDHGSRTWMADLHKRSIRAKAGSPGRRATVTIVDPVAIAAAAAARELRWQDAFRKVARRLWRKRLQR